MKYIFYMKTLNWKPKYPVFAIEYVPNITTVFFRFSYKKAKINKKLSVTFFNFVENGE